MYFGISCLSCNVLLIMYFMYYTYVHMYMHGPENNGNRWKYSTWCSEAVWSCELEHRRWDTTCSTPDTSQCTSDRLKNTKRCHYDVTHWIWRKQHVQTGVEALNDSGGVDEVATTQCTGQVLVQVVHLHSSRSIHTRHRDVTGCSLLKVRFIQTCISLYVILCKV